MEPRRKGGKGEEKVVDAPILILGWEEDEGKLRNIPLTLNACFKPDRYIQRLTHCLLNIRP